MGVPASFDEADVVLDSPRDAPPGTEIHPLNVVMAQVAGGLTSYVSCWKLTAEELAEINRTGRVWLSVFGGLHPPVTVSGVKPFYPNKGSE